MKSRIEREKMPKVKKRGDKYTALVWVPDSNKPLGKAQRRITRRTRSEVEKEIRRIEISKDEGTYLQPLKRLVADYFPEALERYLATADIKPQSASDYRTWLKNHIIPRMGHFQLQELNSFCIESLLLEIQSNGAKGGKPLSSSSMRHIGIVLSICLKTAVRHKHLKQNPMSDVRLPKGHKKKVPALSFEELERVEEVLLKSDPLTSSLIRLSRDSGARKGELLALRWSDIDFENNLISISKTAYDRPGVRYENAPKSKNSARKVELTANQLMPLKVWRKRQSEQRLKAGSYWVDLDYVFTNGRGERISGGYPYALWIKVCDRAGIARVPLHSLRHSHITTLLRAGRPAHIVARRVGDLPTTILETYAHIMPLDDQHSALAFEQAISSRNM